VVRLADGESAVRLLVRDNGPGFTPSMLARAFEPYVTSKPRGTGLGLAIVRKIVDEHGARIDLGNRTDESGTILGAQIALLFTKIAKSGENPRLSAATTA
jgi:nitrogen fixation/metabolism regulation signal transduction histidine kinase